MLGLVSVFVSGPVIAVAVAGDGRLPAAPCLGEFARCQPAGDCTMSMASCGSCGAGEYLCPSDQTTCVKTAADYATCPGIKGTHLDMTLGTEQRLDYIVAHTDLTTQIRQLQNSAPEIPHLGIPAYQWLNDDQHGVGRAQLPSPNPTTPGTPARATVLPNGCALGATWSHQTLHAAGQVLGTEARGLHNGFLDSDPERSIGCNGCGLTLYAPNLNLARDPRWGRAQETCEYHATHRRVPVCLTRVCLRAEACVGLCYHRRGGSAPHGRAGP